MQCEICGQQTDNIHTEICDGCSDSIAEVKGGDQYWWLNTEQKLYKPDYEHGKVREVT